MNIIIYTVVILVIFYFLLRFITNISSKKISKGLRFLIVLGLFVLAILFAIGGRFLLTLPLTLASIALLKLKGLSIFQLISLFRLIQTLRKKFKCDVGYSGHEPGATSVSIPAVMLGATSIERHVTINRTWYGHDQSASLEPLGLMRMVRDIRQIDVILGNAKKTIHDSEIPNMKKLRQKFV